MKRLILMSVLILIIAALHSQTYLYDGHGNLITGTHIRTLPPEKCVLIDPSNNFKYLLDSTHIYITAINNNGDTIWRTDPWKDNNLSIYRTKRPIIVSYHFEKLPKWKSDFYKLKENELVIWIVYFNTQFGFLTLKDGTFFFNGQD